MNNYHIKQRDDFGFKDITLYNAVVGVVGFAVFGRVADGITAGGEEAIDELPVVGVVGER